MASPYSDSTTAHRAVRIDTERQQPDVELVIASANDELRRLLRAPLQGDGISVLEAATAEALLRIVERRDGRVLVVVDDVDRAFQWAQARIWSSWPQARVTSCADAALAMTLARRDRGPGAIAARSAALRAVINEVREQLAGAGAEG